MKDPNDSVGRRGAPPLPAEPPRADPEIDSDAEVLDPAPWSETTAGPPMTTPPGLAMHLTKSLTRALELANELERTIGHTVPLDHVNRVEDRLIDLERRYAMLKRERDDLENRVWNAEEHADLLMNLYVAGYQLHASLDPARVLEALSEVMTNLLGVERFVVLLRRDAGRGYEILLAEGIDPLNDPHFASTVYQGGDPAIDATLADGVLRLGEGTDSRALGVIPLGVDGILVGAIVLLKLFSHKPKLLPKDRELIDLLAANVASALFTAQLFAVLKQKLRAFERAQAEEPR